MDDDNTTRVENEYALLEAMYPGEVAYNFKSKELHYSYLGTSLILRLPDSYPGIEAPQIISATSSSKADLHGKLKDATRALPIGEEALDAVINAFRELLAETDAESPAPEDDAKHRNRTLPQDTTRKQTTIIWLHHLLNTNKRKLALSPADNNVAGISKPGYPGVLIFSGSASSVQEHVNVLKQQNWAAFQIRYEAEVEWIFEHGAGVKEVKSMGEVVRDVGSWKDDFLEAMRMK